jgi:hypothetical protein
VPAISRIERLSIPGVEGATKYISHPNLGINFHLEKEQIYYMGINDSKYERGSRIECRGINDFSIQSFYRAGNR